MERWRRSGKFRAKKTSFPESVTFPVSLDFQRLADVGSRRILDECSATHGDGCWMVWVKIEAWIKCWTELTRLNQSKLSKKSFNKLASTSTTDDKSKLNRWMSNVTGSRTSHPRMSTARKLTVATSNPTRLLIFLSPRIRPISPQSVGHRLACSWHTWKPSAQQKTQRSFLHNISVSDLFIQLIDTDKHRLNLPFFFGCAMRVFTFSNGQKENMAENTIKWITYRRLRHIELQTAPQMTLTDVCCRFGFAIHLGLIYSAIRRKMAEFSILPSDIFGKSFPHLSSTYVESD